jgi:phage shock protein PspC (stress-responsive transcriptional regulator)
MYQTTQPPARLMRSSSGVIGGVCTGLATHYGMSVVFVRLIFMLLTLAYGIGPLLYGILVLLLPAEQPSAFGANSTTAQSSASSAPAPARRKTIFSYIAGGVAGLSALISFVSNVGTILDILPPASPVPAVATRMPVYVIPTISPYDMPTPIPTPIVSSFPASINGTYTLRAVADTDPNLEITRATIDDAQTAIHFRFRNTTGESASISVSPPGDPRSFFIASSDLSRVFLLRDIEGIAIQPQRTVVEPGEDVEFTLIFDRIEDSMTRFHLIEGLVDDPDVIEWVFQNVVLQRRAV